MSSDDDDDDDLLNGLPTFINQKKKSKEDKKLDKFSDYLSQAFDKSDALKERRAAAAAQSKYINDLDEKQKHSNEDECLDQLEPDDSKGMKTGVLTIDWDKLDSMVEEAENTLGFTQSKKKRLLLNSIDGVEEEEEDNDIKGFENLQDRAAVARARATALSSGLGVRRMLGTQHDDMGEHLFINFDAAIKNYKKRVLPKLKGKVRDLFTKSEKEKSIPAMLYRRSLVKLCECSGNSGIPKALIEWLWTVMLSGARCGILCADGAKRTLKGLIQLKNITCVEFFQPDDFVTTLIKVFGYNDRPFNDRNVPSLNQSEIKNIDMMSFEGFLDVWNSLISCVMKDDINESTLLTCIGALSRIGLDPRFHTSFERDLPCRHDVFQVVQELVVTIISILAPTDNDSLPSDSFSCIPSIILESVSGLSAGLHKSEDADDLSGSLPIALAVRNFDAWNVINSPSVVCNSILRIKAELAEKAFIQCVGCRDSWEQSISACNDKLKVKDSLSNTANSRLAPSIQVIVNGAASLLELHRRIDTMLGKGPEFYAAIDLSSQLFLVGEFMLKRSNDNYGETNDGLELFDVDLVEFLRETYEFAEEYCNALKKKIVDIFTKPHLRRSKEFLSTLTILFARMKEDMERLLDNANFRKKSKAELSEGQN